MGYQSNILSEQEVRALLGDVLETQNLSDGTLQVSSGSQKGDGYMSLMTRVKVTGKNKVLHMLLKWAPKSEEFRKVIPLRIAFLREIYFYDEIMPAFRKFQAERNVAEPFNGVPKCYRTVSDDYNETIIMEDIREQGFKLWNRKEQMDDAHVSFMLEQYGKFHAISFAMQDKDLQLYTKLTENVDEIFSHGGDKFKEEFKASFDAVISIFDKKEEKYIQDVLKDFQQNKLFAAFDLLNEKNKYHAISHGDCWCNNMMFKYEAESSKPSQIRLLDFQVVRINSPVIDLCYALYASSSKDIYNNLDHYLQIYYESFSNHMKALGSDANKMYPFDELKNDWKKYAAVGFVMGTVINKAVLKDTEDVVDMMDVCEGGKQWSDVFVLDAKCKAISDERVRNLVLHVYENGFIQ